MAKNYSEIYASIFTNKNKMDFSNAMIRGNGIPLDATEVYNSLNAAIKYAATDPVAYEGQLLAVTENGDTNVYVIGPVNQGNVTIDGASVANYLKLVGKETDLSNYYTKGEVDGLIPTIPSLSIVEDTAAEVPTAETVDVYKNLTANGHQLTEELVQVATAAGLNKVKSDLEAKITAGMTFKGAIATLPAEAEVGDTYKVYGENITVEVDGVKAKAGDTVIYGVGENNTNKWYLIPSGDDIEDTWRPVTNVDNDKTLTFAAGNKLEVSVKADGEITYSHEKVDAPTVVAGGSGRTYITELVSDEYGHITGYKVSTETDQTIPDDIDTTYDLSAEIAEGKADIKLISSKEGDVADVVSVVAGDNVTISKTKDNEFTIAATDSTYGAGDGLELNGGNFNIVVPEDGHVVINDNNEVTIGTLPVYETVKDDDGKDVKRLKEAGTGLFKDVYSKEETNDAIAEAVKTATGGESASDVLIELNNYKKKVNAEVWGDESGAGTEGGKSRIDILEAVGAQANVIESITIDGEALPIDNNKSVELPLALAAKAGLVKSSTAENHIAVATDGTMSVNSLNVNKLVQTKDEWLILNGGGAQLTWPQ